MTYVSLPFKDGMTLPTALAAPVEAGMMLPLVPRPPRQSLFDGPSTTFCEAVVAWTVVMKPSIIPNLSLMTLANGARQLVVQEAFEIWGMKDIEFQGGVGMPERILARTTRCLGS